MISIVIPTYNRADILKECLEHLMSQEISSGSGELRDQFEIIVVNDGGTDETAHVVNNFVTRGQVSVRYLEKKNEGQGIARNYGVREAKGDVIVFIGDDILVESDFVAKHLAFHAAHPEISAGLLGFIEWDPRMPKTPLYTFMTNGSIILGRYGGHQFAFEKLEGKTEASYDFFYTSNISLKKELLLKYTFDESFLKYGWEDIELGYRLTKETEFKLFYDKSLVGYHFHPLDENGLKKRIFAIGKAAVLFHRKYPELGKVPRGLKKFIFWCVSLPLFIWICDAGRKMFGGAWHNWYYYLLSKRFFLMGLQDGLKSL